MRTGGAKLLSKAARQRPKPFPGHAPESIITNNDMHLLCHTQQQIADDVGVAVKTVNDKIADYGENGKYSDSAIFRDMLQGLLAACLYVIFLPS